MGHHREPDLFTIARDMDYDSTTGNLYQCAIVHKPSSELLARLARDNLPLKQWRKFAAPSEVVEVREVNPEPAGKVERRTGALVIYGKSRQFYAHVIAWLKYYGEPPADGIVHLNGNRADNRIVNLALVSAKAKRHRAVVRRGREVVHLGYFATQEERDTAVGLAKLGIFPNGSK